MKQPEHIGKYEVLEEIGRGGMGIVYKALHPVFERYVAIKVLPEYLARQDPDFRTRFLREAKIMVDLSHSGIVRVIDTDSWQGSMYLVMEFVDGWTIRQVMSGADAKGRKPPFELTVDRSVEILQQVASALGYAHDKGIVHRDVKPSNILVDKNGHTWITDFGIAKSLSSATMATQAGVSLGTPEYMAPEQFSEATRGQIDQRADIYSLGCVFFEMVTGKTPFEGETPLGVAYKHVNLTCPRPRQFNPAISPALEQVILKMLAKKRDDRYESCESLREDLLLLKRSDFDHMLAHDVAVEIPEPTEPALGSADLVSKPARARVYVDGKYVGLTPATSRDLPLGPHNAVFTHRGCEEVSATFELTADSPHAVVRATLTVEAQTESEPAGEQGATTLPESDESTPNSAADRMPGSSDQATEVAESEPDAAEPLPPSSEGETTTVIVRPSDDSAAVEATHLTDVTPPVTTNHFGVLRELIPMSPETGLVETQDVADTEPSMSAVETSEPRTVAVHASVPQDEARDRGARAPDAVEGQSRRLPSRKRIIVVASVILVAITGLAIAGRGWIADQRAKQEPSAAVSIGTVGERHPSTGTTVQTGGVTFFWSGASNATQYEFVLYDSAGETRLDKRISATILTVGLPSAETITWKVRGGDSAGNWGDWSDEWSLVVQAPALANGTVSVESDQSGTLVTVDGKGSARSVPVTLGLSPGTHTLAFSKSGFKTTERQVTVKSGETLRTSVTMEKIPPAAVTSGTGSLYVSSSPSGARIYLNGKDSGHTTPWSFEKLAVGTYTVRCSTGSAYKDASQSATVKMGESISVYLTLLKIQSVAATIALSSTPSQAIVYVDGSLWKSMTPCSITGLVPGRTYTLRIEKTGYAPTQKRITVKSGSTPVSVSLQATTAGKAHLSITSSPSGALVFVNGVLVGTTPYSGSSPVIGPVSVRVEKSGYKTESRATVLQSGQQYSLDITLSPEP